MSKKHNINNSKHKWKPDYKAWTKLNTVFKIKQKLRSSKKHNSDNLYGDHRTEEWQKCPLVRRSSYLREETKTYIIVCAGELHAFSKTMISCTDLPTQTSNDLQEKEFRFEENF